MPAKISKMASAVAATIVLGMGSAHAAIVVNDWTLNLTGIDGLGATTVNVIDQITFTGVASTYEAINTGGGAANGISEVGDVGRTRGLLNAQSFISNGVGILPGVSGLGVTYQMTFTFDVLNTLFNVALPSIDQTHPGLDASPALYAGAGSTGLLNIYVDAFANGFTNPNQVTGAGYTGGVLIATFKILPGLGGTFSAATFNGSDDAAFELVSAVPGVILDGPGGNDIGVPGKLLSVTASQFDADFDNNGTLDVPCPAGIAPPPGSPTSNFCAQEDGRASLQVVPEPASLALFGLGLAGLAMGRRKASKQSVA